MPVGSEVTVTLTLPVRKGTKRQKPSILFDFEGVAEGIEKAMGIDVTVEYGYPGRHNIPEVHLAT